VSDCIADKTVLVLGAGEVGAEVGRRLVQMGPRRLVMHGRRPSRAAAVADAMDGSRVDVRASYGDVLLPAEPRDPAPVLNPHDLVNLYADDDASVRTAPLFKLIARWRPDVVIDTLTTATALGNWSNPFELAKDLAERISSLNPSELRRALIDSYTHRSFPVAVRFVRALELAFLELGLSTYIKVSTTGVGGMGFNLRLSHGDGQGARLSSAILSKVGAAGLLHQLLWTLAHTPGTNVKLILPAALIAWETVQPGTHSPREHSIQAARQRLRVPALQPLEVDLGELGITTVKSGDDRFYSTEELALVSTVGQFGLVLKEEVADAVIAALRGGPDIFQAMDRACLGPSYAAGLARSDLLRTMRALDGDQLSVATGNLGPIAAKHLLELALLSEAAGNLDQVPALSLLQLAERARTRALEGDLGRQALVLGLPVVLDEDDVLVPARPRVPPSLPRVMDLRLVEQWVDAGWVDLRVDHVAYWQEELGRLGTIRSRSIGEVLALHYARTGGARTASNPLDSGTAPAVG
jgi:hypothetical protein